MEVIVDSRSHYADGFDKSIFHCRSVFKGLYRPKLCKKKSIGLMGFLLQVLCPFSTVIFIAYLFRMGL